MKRLWLAIAAVVMAVSVRGAAGETLAEAMAAAYLGNPTLVGERAAVRATDEQVPEALSGWRPTVTVTGEAGTSRNSNESSFFTSNQNRNLRAARVNLIQPLFRGGRTVAETRRAESRVLAGRAGLVEIEQEVLLRVATAYMDVVRDQAVLKLAINNEQRLRRQLEAARDRFEVGEVTRTDVAQAEARVSNAVAERVRGESDLINSRAAYLDVVGALPGKLVSPAPAAGLPTSEAEAREIATQEGPTIQRAIQLERAARADIALQFGVLLPTLVLDGEVSHSEDAATRDSKTKSASLIARLTIPLYQSGAEHARVRAARETASQRRVEIEETRRSVLANVTLWWENLQTARAQITAFRDGVRAAKIALDGVEQEAAVGSRTTLDVLDAEQELFKVQIDLVRAEHDDVVASYALEAAIGRLTAQNLGLPADMYDPTLHYDEVRDKFFGIGGD